MKHLTSEQRYEIYLGIKRGWSRSRISREIGVSASTVSRELTRNV
ncbi:helix-turn-helix domain-containing protein, partial [Muribaculum intestinale]